MTGEMTLAGQVLPVGGLKEKILAAHRAGIKKILAPAGTRADIEFNVSLTLRYITVGVVACVDRGWIEHFYERYRIR